MKGIEESRFHHVIATQEFLRAVEHRGAARQG
jgi:hypothetical protein